MSLLTLLSELTSSLICRIELPMRLMSWLTETPAPVSTGSVLHQIVETTLLLSYLAIPVSILVYLKRKPRHNIPGIIWTLAVLFLCFGLFHLTEAVLLYYETSLPGPVSDFINLMISLTTVIVLARLLPMVMTVPSSLKLILELSRENQSRRKSEADLIRMVDSLPHMVAYVDRELHFQHNNKQFVDFYGQTKNELKGRQVVDVLGEEIFQTALPYMCKALAGSAVEYEYCFLNDDKQIRYCKTHYLPNRLDDGSIEGFYVITEDISKAVSRERKLIRQKEEMRLILDTIPSHVWLKDTHNKHVRVNQAVANFYGKTVEEIEGSTAEELFPDLAQDFYIDDLKVIHGKQPILGIIEESRNIHYQRFWIRTDKFPVLDYMGNVTGVLAVSTDVTEAKEYEQELRLITDAIPMFIAYVDPGHVFRYTNAMFEKAFDRSRDQFRGTPLKDLFLANEYDRFEPQLLRAFEGESLVFEAIDMTFADVTMSLEFTLIPDQDDRGNVRGVILVGNDVTERIHREQESIEQKQQMRLILDTIPSFVWFKDTQNNVVRVNSTAAKASQRRIEDIEGRPTSELFPAQADQYYEDDLKVIRTRKPLLDVLETISTCDERHIWLKTDKFPIFSPQGDVSGVLVVSTDITELKSSQQELILARDRAEAANLSKSQFLANMSHEIRTPMTAILGYTELLEETIQSPFALDAIQTIRRNGEHLLNVINDILDLSKIEAGRIELEAMACEIRPFVQELIDLLRVRADAKGIELLLQITPRVPRLVTIDPTRLRQILVNLLGNAIKFTPEGSVTLSVDSPDAGSLVIEVVDTGIGIPQEHLDSIFSPFSQADTSMTRRFGGTGLGLTISRRLAELMCGTLSVSSEPGQGSKFQLRIALDDTQLTHSMFPNDGLLLACDDDDFAHATLCPLPTPVMTTGAASNADNDSPITPTATTTEPLCSGTFSLMARPDVPQILLVEDGPDNQRLIKHLLTRMGYAVTLAENGQAALDRWEEQLQKPGDFNLILMDMQMPVLDGYQAAEQFRTLGYNKPIIALTAHAMIGDRDRCLAAGCDDYLTKPIDRGIFKDLLTKYLSAEPVDV